MISGIDCTVCRCNISQIRVTVTLTTRTDRECCLLSDRCYLQQTMLLLRAVAYLHYCMIGKAATRHSAHTLATICSDSAHYHTSQYGCVAGAFLARPTNKQTTTGLACVYNSTVTGMDRGEALVIVSRKCNQCRREKQCDFSFPLEIIMYNIV